LLSLYLEGIMPNIRHTQESVRLEAKKYQTKIEFKNNNRSAYSTALRLGFLNKICSHMNNGHLFHTFNSCKKEAKKYKTKIEFKNNNRGAYNAALRNKWVEDLCNHMISKRNLREKKLQKKIYNNLKNQYKELEIKMEVTIPKRDNLPGRIDFIIKNPETGKFIGLELKHSESQWSKNACKIQLSKYNRAFRERKGFKGAFLISDNGSIGKSIDIIPKLIKKIL